MIEKNKISMFHVEASSRCNSHCPMCSRYTGLGEVQPGLKETDLDEDVFLKVFTPDFTKQLQHVYFSGVYGDPCLNANLPSFVNYLIKNGCKTVSIDTNGGYRNASWWKKLAHPNVLINFAVDGCSEETLSKYRIGVSYKKVLKNIKEFKANGGKARWNFIVFKHNEHEVEIAKSICKNLQIDFRIKITQKFQNYKNYKIMKNSKQIGVLEPPEDKNFRHPNIGDKDHTPVSVFKFNLDNFNLDHKEIFCKALDRQELYLTADGLLFPCCYLGTYKHDSPGAYQFQQLYDVNDFNLHYNTVDEIITKMEDIKQNWSKSISEGNLLRCINHCGKNKRQTLYG